MSTVRFDRLVQRAFVPAIPHKTSEFDKVYKEFKRPVIEAFKKETKWFEFNELYSQLLNAKSLDDDEFPSSPKSWDWTPKNRYQAEFFENPAPATPKVPVPVAASPKDAAPATASQQDSKAVLNPPGQQEVVFYSRTAQVNPDRLKDNGRVFSRGGILCPQVVDTKKCLGEESKIVLNETDPTDIVYIHNTELTAEQWVTNSRLDVSVKADTLRKMVFPNLQSGDGNNVDPPTSDAPHNQVDVARVYDQLEKFVTKENRDFERLYASTLVHGFLYNAASRFEWQG